MKEYTITTKTSMAKLAKIKELKPMKDYFVFMPSFLGKLMRMASFESLNAGSPTWNAESMAYGARHLAKVASENSDYLIDVYSNEEIKKDKSLKDVKLVHFPGEEGKPFAVVCAGGGYTCVCSVVEGFPVAARLNELGYNVFVLNYRVGNDKVFPKPMDDLAAAISLIIKNAEKYKVDKEHYIVSGFSAGGNLCSEWGTDNHGFAHYGLPKPDALFPVYPYCGFFLNDSGENAEFHRTFHNTMLGKEHTDADKMDYDVFANMSDNYPPCYIVACRDDDTVPVEQSIALAKALEARSIPCILDLGEKGGHGFGDGRGTDVEGWVDRAVEFWRNLNN